MYISWIRTSQYFSHRAANQSSSEFCDACLCLTSCSDFTDHTEHIWKMCFHHQLLIFMIALECDRCADCSFSFRAMFQFAFISYIFRFIRLLKITIEKRRRVFSSRMHIYKKRRQAIWRPVA